MASSIKVGKPDSLQPNTKQHREQNLQESPYAAVRKFIECPEP
jgi:hypothetical protein